jgi:hypothetical protein
MFLAADSDTYITCSSVYFFDNDFVLPAISTEIYNGN